MAADKANLIARQRRIPQLARYEHSRNPVLGQLNGGQNISRLLNAQPDLDLPDCEAAALAL
jgi:hypothetical protein